MEMKQIPVLCYSIEIAAVHCSYHFEVDMG